MNLIILSPSNVQASTTDGTVCFGHLFAVTRSADCPFTPATDHRAVVGSAQGDLTAYPSALAITMVGSTVIRTRDRGVQPKRASTLRQS